ncbi:MAG: MGMT family protein [Candidatus Woesearchaeota archaeon]
MNRRVSFSERVYEATRRIPRGRVSTYAEIARFLKCRAFRAVGSALHKNPTPMLVPCHRVVKSDGSVGGFAFGKKKKIQLLMKEGILIRGDKIIDFEKKFIRLKK